MKKPNLPEIKQELLQLSQHELMEICLTLSKFKIENKELVSYLLFESYDEQGYINRIKLQMDEQFLAINTHSYFYIKKSVRKILSVTKKQIKYSKKKETEIDLLIYFCQKLQSISPSIQGNTVLANTYTRQLTRIKTIIATLHEDLIYDYHQELANLV